MSAVEKGTMYVDSTEKSIKEVGEAAQSVAVMIDSITNKAQEQSNSLSQITVGIDQVSSVVQTNSATAQESAAASEELSGQAQILKDLVERFQLKTKDGPFAAMAEPFEAEWGE